MKNKIIFENKPYNHLVWDDFLPESIMNYVRSDFNKLTANDFLTHSSGYKYAACTEIEILKFIYSTQIKKTLESYFKRKIIRAKKYPFPQYYEFPENSAGLPPHTDAGENRDLAMIIYLNEDWKVDDSGELVIMSTNERAVKTIEPTFNKMACLQLDKNAWHAVNKTGALFKRKTLIIDWDFS